MRTWVWMPVLGVAVLLVAVGCWFPLLVMRDSAPFLMPDLEVSVLDCATRGDANVQLGDMYFAGRPGRWPARSILVAALACFALVASGRRLAAVIACLILGLAIGWLFLRIGAEHVAHAGEEEAGWTYGLFPVRSASSILRNSWWTWSALVAGAFLSAVAAWLRAGGARWSLRTLHGTFK